VPHPGELVDHAPARRIAARQSPLQPSELLRQVIAPGLPCRIFELHHMVINARSARLDLCRRARSRCASDPN
jgi:hypothetical protein